MKYQGVIDSINKVMDREIPLLLSLREDGTCRTAQ